MFNYKYDELIICLGIYSYLYNYYVYYYVYVY